MRRQLVRRGKVTFALIGCLCLIATGCGDGPGEEFRTYNQTVAEVPPAADPSPDRTATSETPTGSDSIEQGNSDSQPIGSIEADNVSADVTTDVAVTEDVDTTPPADAEPTETQGDIIPAEALSGVDDPVQPIPTESNGDTLAEETIVATEPREIELLIPDNDFQVEGPDEALRVSYDDIDLLKVLNMDPVPRIAPTYFPSWLNGLAEERIRIRGFMYPPPIEEGIPAFVLARDNQICCFGRNPMPYDIVPVIMTDDVTTSYINGRPFDVVGVFHISVEMDLDDPTKVKFVYYIDDAIVIDE